MFSKYYLKFWNFDNNCLIQVEMNGYTFRGSNSTIFNFASLLSRDQHIEEFASLVDPILERLCCQ